MPSVPITAYYTHSHAKTQQRGQSREPSPKSLLDQGRDAVRLKHTCIRTEETYVAWIKHFILFHGKRLFLSTDNRRHPRQIGALEIEAFLTYLAVDRKVAASTQNQTLSALLFLYRDVLKADCAREGVEDESDRAPGTAGRMGPGCRLRPGRHRHRRGGGGWGHCGGKRADREQQAA